MSDSFSLLVVDDHADNRFSLRALLTTLPGCTVIEAESGEAALACILQQDVHLILLDVHMPGMDGFETARHLQMIERSRDIPLVFLTAKFQAAEFAARGFALGAVDYLTKPIDDTLLLSRVRLYQRLSEREQRLEHSLNLQIKSEGEMATTRAVAEAMATQLEAARQMAERASRAKSVFLANMSHELLTPLNAIIGFARLVVRDPALGDHSRPQVVAILAAGERLQALINDVLDISRIEGGRIVSPRVDFDPRRLFDDLYGMFRPRADEKQLAFTADCPHPLPANIGGDLHHLRQILVNLLDNAIKYTEQGAVSVQLRLDDGAPEVGAGDTATAGPTGTPRTPHLIFEVADSGPGIPVAEQAGIFDAFSQTGLGIAKGEGTGLGLYLGREYARLMGARLSLLSSSPQGSVFRLCLPLVPLVSLVPTVATTVAIPKMASPPATGSVATGGCDLGKIPLSLVRQLHDVAEALGLSEAKRLAGQIREFDASVADVLDHMLHDFRFDHIIDACNAVKEH